MPPRPATPRARQLRAPVPPDDLRHAAYAANTAAIRRALLARVRAECEDRPGTYQMLGATGLVLYVGKAKRLRTRLLSYFRSAQKNRRRDRQARILRHAHAVEWAYAPDEFGALVAELRLIKRHRPRFNILLNSDDGPRAWLALTDAPVPALRVERRTDAPDAALLYGPFRRLYMLDDAVRALADATGVRDCDAGTGRHAACLRAQLGTCACPARAGDSAYEARVGEVRDFLAGRTRAPIDTLAARMHAAAADWHFERAAVLKERLAALGWLAGRLERFNAAADRLTFRYDAVGYDGSTRVYLIRRGTVRAECPAPATPEEQAALDVLARRVLAPAGGRAVGGDVTRAAPAVRDAAGPAPPVPTHDLDEFYLVASWFRRHPAELARTTAA